MILDETELLIGEGRVEFEEGGGEEKENARVEEGEGRIEEVKGGENEGVEGGVRKEEDVGGLLLPLVCAVIRSCFCS